jgi:hypothetical protein
MNSDSEQRIIDRIALAEKAAIGRIAELKKDAIAELKVQRPQHKWAVGVVISFLGLIFLLAGFIGYSMKQQTESVAE